MRALLNRVLFWAFFAALLAVPASLTSFPAAAQSLAARDAARDLVFGTWILNREKSDYRVSALPLSVVRIYQPHPAGVKHTIVTTTDRGTTVSEYVAEYDSMEYPVKGSEGIDAMTLTSIDSHTAEIVLRHGGRDIGFARRVISPDGMHMTMTVSIGSARNVAVYDKQP